MVATAAVTVDWFTAEWLPPPSAGGHRVQQIEMAPASNDARPDRPVGPLHTRVTGITQW